MAASFSKLIDQSSQWQRRIYFPADCRMRRRNFGLIFSLIHFPYLNRHLNRQCQWCLLPRRFADSFQCPWLHNPIAENPSIDLGKSVQTSGASSNGKISGEEYARIGIAGGVAVALAGWEAGAVVGKAISSAIGALTTASVGAGIVVIGEGMADRVIPTALSRGTEWYKPADAPPEQWMQNNIDWINQKMDQGYCILDFGAAPGRVNFLEAKSPYYQAELDQISSRDYSYATKNCVVMEIRLQTW